MSSERLKLVRERSKLRRQLLAQQVKQICHPSSFLFIYISNNTLQAYGILYYMQDRFHISPVSLENFFDALQEKIFPGRVQIDLLLFFEI